MKIVELIRIIRYKTTVDEAEEVLLDLLGEEVEDGRLDEYTKRKSTR